MTELNVKEFGAKGDGATNDRAAIQRAIDAANDDDVVVIPEGVYLVNNDALKLRKEIVLKCDGLYKTVLLRGQKAPAILDATAGTVVGLEYWMDARSNFRKAILAHDFQHLDIIQCTFASGASREGRTDEEWTNHAVYAHSGSGLYIQEPKLHNTQIKLGGGAGGISDVLVDGVEAWAPVQYAVSVVARKAGAVIEDISIEDVICHDVRGSGVIYIGDDEGENPDLDVTVRDVYVTNVLADGDVKDGQCKLVHARPAGQHSRDWILDGLEWRPSRKAKGSQGVTCFPRSQYDRMDGFVVRGLRIAGAGVDLHGFRVAGDVGFDARDLDIALSRGVDIRGSTGTNQGPHGRIHDIVTADISAQALMGPVGTVLVSGTHGDILRTEEPPFSADVYATEVAP